MHFQGTPITGGYDTADDCGGGWGGCRTGRTTGGGLVGVFNTRLAILVDGGALEIPNVRCLVYSLDRRPLSWRKLQFTSAASPVR